MRRIAWTGNASNQAPTAAVNADTLTGNSPLTVDFNSTGTSDPDAGDLLTYEWDLDGDGEFDDSAETSADAHLPRGRHLHGHAARHRHVRRKRHGRDHDLRAAARRSRPRSRSSRSPTRASRRRTRHELRHVDPLQATGSVPRRESYLRFQLAGINGRVVSAKLRLTSTTDGTKDGPALFRAGDSWSESALTWSNRPARDAQPVADVGAIPLGTVAEYDATGAGDRRRDGQPRLVPTFNDNVDFGSREFTEPAKRPQLGGHLRRRGAGHRGADPRRRPWRPTRRATTA